MVFIPCFLGNLTIKSGRKSAETKNCMNQSFFRDKEIYYRVNVFQPSRSTLVFIHGLSGSSSSWAEYEKRFQDGYNILNFDLRGHGASKRWRKYTNYQIKFLADDLHDLVEHLNIQKFVLIAHSFGTLVAFEFIKNYPSLVEKVVFFSPDFYPRRRFFVRLMLPLLYCSRVFDFLPFSPKIGRHVDYYKFMNTYDWDPRRIFVDVSNTTLRSYLYCFLQSNMANYESFLGQINVPVLIFHGKSDTFFPVSSGIIISRKIKNSKLILLEGDHFILFKKIDIVVSEIERFIASV